MHERLASTTTTQATRLSASWSPAIHHLATVLPVYDLAPHDEDSLGLPVAAAEWRQSGLAEEMAAVLFRSRRCHPLLVGGPGIGKTFALHDLARRAAQGEIPFLSERRFLWIDCRHIGPSDSRACLELIFSAVRGEESLVLCLDGLAGILRRANGESNRTLLCSLFDRLDLRVLGVMAPWEYADLIAGDAELLRYFSRIDMDEPDESITTAIVQRHALVLSQHHAVTILPEIVEQTVRWTSNFLLNEHHPAKDIHVLTEACEGLVYHRDQRGRDRRELRLNDVVEVLQARTGIPQETLLGSGSDTDFAETLSAAVVGQPQAIDTVARELRLIKAGLTAADKPATVLLFAGLTGVGKTELAKRIAEVYSTSRSLQVYSMGNFTEPHSVSGIIGVPPGYVGHEYGGRIVNDLNADPYSVFLLDEAEKCHPNIWKPFLNLFDEGWILDQRGVKARAERAIFILTTNAGDRHLSQLAEAGKSEEEVAEAVRSTLSRIRLERSSQPVFPPQFLSRIRRIVVFRPLDQTAMQGIATRAGKRLIEQWQRKRGVSLEVAAEVWHAIGQLAHQLNQASHQQEGGRVVQKLLDQLLQDGLQSWLIGLPSSLAPDEIVRVQLGNPVEQVSSSTLLQQALQFDVMRRHSSIPQ